MAKTALAVANKVDSKIFVLRGQRVILDTDLLSQFACLKPEMLKPCVLVTGASGRAEPKSPKKELRSSWTGAIAARASTKTI